MSTYNEQMAAYEDTIGCVLRLHSGLASFNIEPVVSGGYVEFRDTVDAYWK